MRIAILSIEYPPQVMGGAGVYIAHVASGLVALGHEVHVITAGNSPDYTRYADEGVQVHRLPVLGKLGPALSYWTQLPGYFRKLDTAEARFDLIHNNNLSDLTLPRWRAPQPRLMTVHHLCATTVKLLKPSMRQRFGQLGGELGFGPIWERICIGRADLLIAVSENTAADLLSTYKVDPAQVTVIQHGARPQDYLFAPQELADVRAQFNATGGSLLLAVGRLESRKGTEVLLRAVALLKPPLYPAVEKDNLRLIIAGSGDQAPYRALTAALGIADVVAFAGRVDDRTLCKLYAACDLVAFPSLMEGLGLVALDARAAGKYVVASRVGGIPEVVPSGAGTLVTPGDPLELAHALADALQRRIAAPRGVPPVPTWENAVRQLNDCYHRVIGQTTSRQTQPEVV